MEKLTAGARKLGISLNRLQTDKFRIFYRELVEWNKKINLTGITDYEEVITKHFLDSLTVISARQFQDTDMVIDIGTGAGLPGLPLLITFPWLKLVLLEATAKKITFIKYITEKLGLSVTQVINERAETLAHRPEYREQFDVVLSRAVAVLPVTVELALPFCKPGGIFISQKKGNVTLEVSQAAKAIGILGGKLREIKPITLTELPDSRQLVIIDKINQTPELYPRRNGLPQKRPIR